MTISEEDKNKEMRLLLKKVLGQQTLQESGTPLYVPYLNFDGKGSENNWNEQIWDVKRKKKLLSKLFRS